eukprot:626865-Prymnesium_polylepis.2
MGHIHTIHHIRRVRRRRPQEASVCASTLSRTTLSRSAKPGDAAQTVPPMAEDCSEVILGHTREHVDLPTRAARDSEVVVKEGGPQVDSALEEAVQRVHCPRRQRQSERRQHRRSQRAADKDERKLGVVENAAVGLDRVRDGRRFQPEERRQHAAAQEGPQLHRIGRRERIGRRAGLDI